MPNAVRKIMGAGQAPLAAQMMSGDVADSLTATGSTQGTAYQVSADNNFFTTVAASTGAILPGSSLAQPGDEVAITNLGANSLTVYPPVGGQINNVAVNGGFSIAANKTAIFIARTGGLNWAAVLSA